MVGIKELRLDSIDIVINEDGDKITGFYSIISTKDKVLAKQAFNGYNDVKVVMSPDTRIALDAFLVLFKKDVGTTTGLID